jgi:hypothetical protein
MKTLRDDPNEAKATFDEIYSQSDPRAYFATLGSLDYSIPDLAKPIFKQIASAWHAEYGRSATILDLGSSYGINSALFRFPLTFSMLRRRYAQRAMLNLPSDHVHQLDKNYFRAWPRIQPERIIIADVSEPAVSYAVRVGVADIGIAGSFEGGLPDATAATALPNVDIIMSTGCVGYVTERTFQTLMDSAKQPTWVVSFVLRMFDYAPIEDALASAGLVTEKLTTAAFVQRRFRDEEEATGVLDLLNKRGLDPSGLEAEGLLFAELYLSRPRADVERRPLDSIVTVASGRNLSFGPRLMRVGRGERSELAAVRL